MADARITPEMLEGEYRFTRVGGRDWRQNVASIQIKAQPAGKGWDWFVWDQGEKPQRVPRCVSPQTKTQLNQFIQRLYWKP